MSQTASENTIPPSIAAAPDRGRVLPDDLHDQHLVANVHPLDWRNPEPARRYNLVVIGAGTAGLVTAAGAAGLGAKVALVERHLMGGDCLTVGCVPSKCVIKSSRLLGDVATAGDFGIRIPPGSEADFAAVMERMRRLRAGLSHTDSAERFRGLGVDVFLGDGSFSGPDTVSVAGKTLRFKRAVIATGARAAHPPIPGMADVGYLTNESVFTLTSRPRRLAVIGGGPIGCELAQAFRRLGCEVVLLNDTGHLLNREDPDAAEIVQQAFVREGIRLLLNVAITRAERRGGEKVLTYRIGDQSGEAVVDEILVGAGRVPNIDGLGLETVGVQADARTGIVVDDHLRSSNPRIFACGDACLPTKFTHAADATARLVIQNALFHGRKTLSSLVIPWCTYTAPEIAHVGISEEDARARGIALSTFTIPMSEVDRAVADGETEGFVKIHVKQGGDEILGATIVAGHAGEMMNEITLAMVKGIGLGSLASVIHPYPTQADAIRKAGDAYNRTRLTPLVKRLFSTWLRLTR